MKRGELNQDHCNCFDGEYDDDDYGDKNNIFEVFVFAFFFMLMDTGNGVFEAVFNVYFVLLIGEIEYIYGE